MSDEPSVYSSYSAGVTPVSFSEKYAGLERFRDLYQQGMMLVEATSEYLEGEGRREARNLKSPTSLTYATESMRLTTRLMQLSSCLLVRRSQLEGEISAEKAEAERGKISLETISRPSHVPHFEELPDGLKELIRESFRLIETVLAMERMLHATKSDVAAHLNPVATQVEQIDAAFATGGR